MSWLRDFCSCGVLLASTRGREGRPLLGNALAAQLLAACLLQTLSSPSLRLRGERKGQHQAALGGVFRILSSWDDAAARVVGLQPRDREPDASVAA
jgi:hypothetical protein